MAWYAVYETDTGRLVSLGTVLAEPFPAGLSTVALSAEPDLPTAMWDAPTRAFVPRPAKVLADRMNDLLTDPDYGDLQGLWPSLAQEQQAVLVNVTTRLLGRARWRNPRAPVTIEPGV